MNHILLRGRGLNNILCIFGAMFVSIHSNGIILMNSNDAQRNTSAPSGELAMSGFELQGQWGAFLGTPISWNYFVTAKHVGGSVEQEFKFQGQSYTTSARFDDAQSDLVIWKVAKSFPVYASLFSSSDEIGKPVVVFGRGGPKQNSVDVETLLGPEQKGWHWGDPNGVLRWGENMISSIVQSGGGIIPLVGGQGDNGELLKCPFDKNGGLNEAHLSVGDSGGGLFIKSGDKWKLAGINYAVDGPYNTIPSGPGFGAAIFDEGGLYKGGEGKWQPIPDLPSAQPGSFYSTRVSSRLGWIQSVIANDQAVEQPPVLEVSSNLPGTFTPISQAQFNTSSKTFTVPRVGSQQYYRLRAEKSYRIHNVRIEDGNFAGSYSE